MIKEVFDKPKLDKLTFTPDYVWAAYALLDKIPADVPTHGRASATLLVSLIHCACRNDKELKPYGSNIDEKGGRGKMYQPFGAEMAQIIEESN